jgi:hypothetical protein
LTGNLAPTLSGRLPRRPLKATIVGAAKLVGKTPAFYRNTKRTHLIRCVLFSMVNYEFIIKAKLKHPGGALS